MRIDIDDIRELINQRLQFATEDYEDDRKRNRNGMKCFHQGQVDAFQEVLEMLEELEEMEGEEWTKIGTMRTCGTRCAERWKNLPLKD